MAQVPASHQELLNSPIHVTLATTMPDNTPQTTVLWFKWDGENVLLSTARGRQKTENIEKNPQVSLMFVDPENIYKHLEIRGTVEIVKDDTFDLIDELAKKYTGQDSYYGGVAPAENKGKEDRVILKIKPEHVVTYG